MIANRLGYIYSYEIVEKGVRRFQKCIRFRIPALRRCKIRYSATAAGRCEEFSRSGHGFCLPSFSWNSRVSCSSFLRNGMLGRWVLPLLGRVLGELELAIRPATRMVLPYRVLASHCCCHMSIELCSVQPWCNTRSKYLLR